MFYFSKGPIQKKGGSFIKALPKFRPLSKHTSKCINAKIEDIIDFIKNNDYSNPVLLELYGHDILDYMPLKENEINELNELIESIDNDKIKQTWIDWVGSGLPIREINKDYIIREIENHKANKKEEKNLNEFLNGVLPATNEIDNYLEIDMNPSILKELKY